MTPERDSSLEAWQNEVACELLARPNAQVVRAVLQRIAKGVSSNAVRVVCDKTLAKPEVLHDEQGTTLSLSDDLGTLNHAKFIVPDIEDRHGLSLLSRDRDSIDATVSRMRRHERTLALALHSAFGVEVEPIVDGLLRDLYRETKKIDDDTPDLIARALEEGPVKAKDVRDATKMALRDRSTVKGERNDKVSHSLLAMKHLASNSPRAREQWLRRAKEHALGNVGALADAIVEDGWKTLLNMPAVTKEERLRLERDPRARMLKPPEDAPSIREAANCDHYAGEMQALRTYKDWIPLQAKEIAVLMDMYATMVKFPYALGTNKGPEQSSHITGTPTAFERDRRFTCFTGPWMMSALLLAAGFKENDLFYVNKISSDADDNWDGTHAFLFLMDVNRQLIKIDPASFEIGTPLTGDNLDSRTRKRLSDFIGGKPEDRQRVVPVTLDRDLAPDTHLPLHFQVLPLRTGIASSHYLNTGIGFYQEGKFKEAEMSLRLSLNQNPENVDALYYLALIAWKNGDMNQAEADFLEALRIAPARVWTMFSYGQFLLNVRGVKDRAIPYLLKVAQPKFKPWGDDSCIAKAKRILTSLGVEIPKPEAKVPEQERKSDDGRKQQNVV